MAGLVCVHSRGNNRIEDGLGTSTSSCERMARKGMEKNVKKRETKSINRRVNNFLLLRNIVYCVIEDNKKKFFFSFFNLIPSCEAWFLAGMGKKRWEKRHFITKQRIRKRVFLSLSSYRSLRFVMFNCVFLSSFLVMRLLLLPCLLEKDDGKRRRWDGRKINFFNQFLVWCALFCLRQILFLCFITW